MDYDSCFGPIVLFYHLQEHYVPGDEVMPFPCLATLKMQSLRQLSMQAISHPFSISMMTFMTANTIVQELMIKIKSSNSRKQEEGCDGPHLEMH
jgi:hypothetical protein